MLKQTNRKESWTGRDKPCHSLASRPIKLEASWQPVEVKWRSSTPPHPELLEINAPRTWVKTSNAVASRSDEEPVGNFRKRESEAQLFREGNFSLTATSLTCQTLFYRKKKKTFFNNSKHCSKYLWKRCFTKSIIIYIIFFLFLFLHRWETHLFASPLHSNLSPASATRCF